MPSLSLAKEVPAQTIEVTTYQREEIVPLLPLLNQWILREFSQYPYCSPPKDLVVFPSDIIFVNSREALVALAKKEDQVIGMITLIAFDSPSLHAMYLNQWFPHLLEEVRAHGFDPSKFLYVDYFLTEPSLHNDEQTVQALYQTLLHFAKKLGKTQLCYMADVGHPTNSGGKYSVEPWGEVIYGFQSMEIRTIAILPTIDPTGGVKEREHTIEFFFKNLETQP